MPIECHRIYFIFTDLSRARQQGHPISFVEMKAYTEILGISLSRRDIDAIQRFDSVLLNRTIEMSRKARE